MRVALLMDQSTSYGRAVFAGVRRRLLPRLDCRLLIAEPTPAAWAGLVAGGIDAALVHAGTQALASAVERWGGPAVNVSGAVATHVPTCTVDNLRLGRMGADFLLAREVVSFGFVGRLERLYSRQRADGFAARLGERERTCRVRDWVEDPHGCAAWIAKLPQPCGVLVSGDELGVRVISACHEAGISVPERALVLSATEDPVTCLLARPTLSSIAFDAERIGDEAAGLMLRLAAGEPAPSDPCLAEPTHIVERASTEAAASRDPAVAAALHWLQDHAAQAIGVDDVADAVGVGRRSLERRFAAMVGRSVYQHLLAIRLDLAKQLLRSGADNLDTVAQRCGFAGARHLCEVFRQREGRTPASYRSGT
jgi:LacI family transcriptional regulator